MVCKAKAIKSRVCTVCNSKIEKDEEYTCQTLDPNGNKFNNFCQKCLPLGSSLRELSLGGRS